MQVTERTFTGPGSGGRVLNSYSTEADRQNDLRTSTNTHKYALGLERPLVSMKVG